MTAALNPLYRFDTLVVGAANRLAVTAAKAVAEAPGTVYNPLFVYAQPGLGKTHLLMAVGHAARAINPRLTVEYLTLDEFVESFHAAIAAGQGEVHRRRFAEIDLLLVDDVQFLTHRREMQAELLRVTDALQAANRQIVLTSDRPPSEIEALDERLIRRFAGGLAIDVGGPDYETRVAILRRKADERRASFGSGVLEAVAQLDIDNVRELLGALNRLVAHQAVSETPLDPAAAIKAVGGDRATRPNGAAAGAPEHERGHEPARAPAERSDALPLADGDGASEFADFLSEVSATLSQQVDTWRSKVGAAILRWEGEGYRTRRLEALLEQEPAADPEEALREFEADVERLQALQAETAELAPELAGSPAFRDPGDVAAAEALVQRAREAAQPPLAPSPRWKLEDLVEGAENRVALQAAKAVAAEPATRYNPLVVVGAGGVGKTHLLHAIGNALAAQSSTPIACLSARAFIDELIDAIDRDRVPTWRARYRRVAALLLDDVHLIAGKDRTQDELFVLFNFLHESGRQMVFTSPVPLGQVPGLEPRLRTRLEGGLVMTLALPREVLDRHAAASAPNAGAAGIRPAPSRTSGIVAPIAAAVRSREKMIWDWPELADRVIEEWR